MKYFFTYLLILFSTMGFSQTTLEGFYDLSQFEMPARLFLLADGQFYYSAIFGSVDLEIYGTYSIQGEQLFFQPKEEQMQPFILYARENKTSEDSLSFYYYQPKEDSRFQLVFLADKQWINSSVKAENNGVLFKIKKKRIDSLSIGYPAIQNELGLLHVRNTYKANIPIGQNDFLIFYNRYYQMRKQFSKSPLQLKDTNIITNKIRSQEPLAEGEREKIYAFIQSHKMFENSTVNNEQFYERILLTTGTIQPKLEWRNGQLFEAEE